MGNKTAEAKENVARMLNKLQLKGYGLGHTKVFLKYYHMELLVIGYEQKMQKIIRIQALVRRWLAMKQFRRLRLQMRGHGSRSSRETLISNTSNSSSIGTGSTNIASDSASDRIRKNSDKDLKAMAAAVKIQAVFRGYNTRKKYTKELQKKNERRMRRDSGNKSIENRWPILMMNKENRNRGGITMFGYDSKPLHSTPPAPVRSPVYQYHQGPASFTAGKRKAPSPVSRLHRFCC
jgi:hypothetical protein